MLSLDFLDLDVEVAQRNRDLALTAQLQPNASDRVTRFEALDDQRLECGHFNPSLTPLIRCHNNARVVVVLITNPRASVQSTEPRGRQFLRPQNLLAAMP